jgi:hypothetical protein
MKRPIGGILRSTTNVSSAHPANPRATHVSYSKRFVAMPRAKEAPIMTLLRSTYALICRAWRHAECQYAAAVDPTASTHRIDGAHTPKDAPPDRIPAKDDQRDPYGPKVPVQIHL